MLPVLRIAPTPSGYLHLGNGVNFALTAAAAVALGGDLRLRIDDLDGARVRDDYLLDLRETLRWLLPERVAELWAGAYRQSEHRGDYDAALDALRQTGRVYACSCTRRQLRAAGVTDVNAYPGTCRDRGLALDGDGVWRTRDGDIVVRGRDGVPSYQLASVLDDVALGTTHLVRGADLASSTAIQYALAGVLGEADVLGERAASFLTVRAYHHPLVTDAAGEKLSKSAGADSLRGLRRADVPAARVYRAAARVLGRAEVDSLESLAAYATAFWA